MCYILGMSQLHLYLPEPLARKARRQAEAEGSSVSSYLARIVRRELEFGWPEAFFERVVGSWQGEPLRRPSQQELENRDELE